MAEAIDVLLFGGGGREHAIAFALRKSPRLARLYAAPGNPGIAALAECLSLDPDDHAGVIRFCREAAIGLVVIGPEAPLAAGLVDALTRAGIPAFGPTSAAARLESSKSFTKRLAAKAGLPTADWRAFDDCEAALDYIREVGAPVVVKADGLASGKGVTVADNLEDAERAVWEVFRTPGASVVIEERLEGPEASLFALCDGADAILFGTAEDHKRAFDGDQGPNTGGMGAVSPSIRLDPALTDRAMREIVRPTLQAMAERGTPFRGILYAGLMLTADGPKLIEYNVRFGDPEAQALLLRLDDDLLDLMLAATDGRLAGRTVRYSDQSAVCVVAAARGYPGPVERGAPIRRIEAGEAAGAVVFHAGTAETAEGLVTAGGRVLGVSALGPSLAAARDTAYRAVAALDFPGGFWRTDIGLKAAEAEGRR